VFKPHFILLFIVNVVIALTTITSMKIMAADVDPTRPFGVSGSGLSQLKQDDGFLLTSIIHKWISFSRQFNLLMLQLDPSQ
jgi:MSHA biogenesis protein MshK